ncbi:MAG: FtsQ-type POTRA domain-containing protein [Nitriliruptorales bacterium]|nr:FtsQ-type POTRA domain-containing protein [Nitriliruptorales bacterium]
MSTATRTTHRPPMDARIRQRRIEVQREHVRRRRRMLGAVVLLALAAAGAVGITRSPLFAITAVRVEGVERPEARLIKDVAQIRTGQNLMTADLDDAVERTRALPWVASAQVRRDAPSTVVLDVVPRRPVGILRAASGNWLVDSEGVVIARARDRLLPHIDVTIDTVLVPGVRIDDPAARNALALHQSLPRDVRSALLAVEAVGARTVRVRLALHRLADPDTYRKGQKTWVRLGAAGDVDKQLTVLRALLGQMRKARAGVPSEVDVRVPGNPTVIP